MLVRFPMALLCRKNFDKEIKHRVINRSAMLEGEAV